MKNNNLLSSDRCRTTCVIVITMTLLAISSNVFAQANTNQNNRAPAGAIQQNQLLNQQRTTAEKIPFSSANLYLINGENINGKLLQVDGQTITIESDKGYGVLTIPKADVLMITYPESEVNVSRRYGLGYFAKSNIISGVSDTLNYNLNQISLRTYFNESFILQWLAGFGSLSVNVDNPDTIDPNDTKAIRYQIFTASIRAAGVLKRNMNNVIYSGASFGFISTIDDSRNVEDSGVIYSVYLGAELFLFNMPNFGFSGEVAFDGLNTTNLSRFEISVSPIPTFSVHYYF